MANGRIGAILIAQILSTAVYSLPAYACPAGHYNHCVGPSWARICGCLPNSGTVIDATTTLPDAITTITGVIEGDREKILQGVGGAVLKSTAPAAPLVAQTLNAQDKLAFAQQVIGRGFLLLLVGAPPELVIVDGIGNIVDRFIMSDPPANPIVDMLPPAQPRGVHNFTATQATCMVTNPAGELIVGWINMPTLTNSGDGKVTSLESTDLRQEDIVTISADDCPFQSQGNGAQTGITSAKLKFKRSESRFGPASGSRYFLYGQAISN